MKASQQILGFKEVNSSSYDAVDLDSLVMYAIAKLSDLRLELSLENIIVATFRLFPKKFSLVGYPEIADATRVEKCLWRCKGKKRRWLGGKTPHGYLLTERGRLVAEHASGVLRADSEFKHKATSQTRRKESIINELTSCTAYQKYLQGQGETITEAEFCYLLQGTLDSLKDTLRRNLDTLKVIVDDLRREDIARFLGYLEQRFQKFLYSG